MNGQEQQKCDRQTARIAVLEAQLAEREKAVEKALNSAQKAIDKAEGQLMSRLEGFPQIYLSRDEYTREHQHLIDRIDVVDKHRQHYITVDKYEDKLKSEATARETALLRVDEKFEEYVKRYEQRQREVDQALTIQKTSAAEAQRFVEQQGFKFNRNIAILGVVLAGLVILMNILGIGSGGI